jgi:phosphonoacetaldehyde hydrolase
MNLTAVIFDWAGTVVDHGSRAPVATLLEVFQGAGLALTVEDARLSMGIAKRAHIASILALPQVASEWQQLHGAMPVDADVDRLYAAFVPRQLACLERYSDVMTGVPAAVEQLRSRGLKIGSTTGYTRQMPISCWPWRKLRDFHPIAPSAPRMCPAAEGPRRGCAI